MIELAASMAAGYFSKNEVALTDVAAVVRTMYNALVALQAPAFDDSRAPVTFLVVPRSDADVATPVEEPTPLPPPASYTRQAPAVPIKKSVYPDHIVCLECGNNHKMLRRHLTTAHGLTVEEYLEKWGLPVDYPLVSPNYAERRSALAKQIGLGKTHYRRASNGSGRGKHA